MVWPEVPDVPVEPPVVLLVAPLVVPLLVFPLLVVVVVAPEVPVLRPVEFPIVEPFLLVVAPLDELLALLLDVVEDDDDEDELDVVDVEAPEVEPVAVVPLVEAVVPASGNPDWTSVLQASRPVSAVQARRFAVRMCSLRYLVR